jgi:hypothetical protein
MGPGIMTNRAIPGGTAAILAFSVASTACSTVTTAASAPRPPSPVMRGAPLSCRVTGGPVVMARQVFVPSGVETLAHEGGFEVRFAAARSRCASVDWPWAPEDPREVPCPLLPGVDADVTAKDDTKTTLASGSNVAGHEEGGVPPADGRSVLGVTMSHQWRSLCEGREAFVECPLRASRRGWDGSEATEVVPIGGERFLRLSVDGGVESHQLRAQVFASSGEAVGPSLDLSPQGGSVIGRASVAIAPDGDGLVTYIASTDDGFDVLGTPISCATR